LDDGMLVVVFGGGGARWIRTIDLILIRDAL
jgi:hypothetical protein